MASQLYCMKREVLTKFIQQAIAEIPELGPGRVLLENPDISAKFPVCVLYNFQARPRYFRAAYALSITVEVWAEKFYEAESLYQKVAERLAELNFTEVNPTPQSKDLITKKQRYGSTFEAGWNAVSNSLYKNRS